MILLTAEQMRQADRRTIEEIGLPGIVLMENAAQGAVRALVDQVGDLSEFRVAVLCGRGNNGGDGLAMARILVAREVEVVVYLLTKKDKLSGDAATNLAVAEATGVPVVEVPDETAFLGLVEEMASYDLYVDALLGTGLNSPVQGVYGLAIDFLNEMGAPIMAVDIPSGLAADTGVPLGRAVQAACTATFGQVKLGMALDPVGYSGEITLVDISIPPQVIEDLDPDVFLLEREMVAHLLPERPSHAHKGDFGHLLVVGGSVGKTGAPCLAAMGGLRSGAGLVTAALPAALQPIAALKLTAAMTEPLAETADGGLALAGLATLRQLMAEREALVLGPGLGKNPETWEAVRELAAGLESPMVLDADALNALAGTKTRFVSEEVVITPHPGEAARLLGTDPAAVAADRLGAARRLAAAFGAVCVLKGARTVVALPDGPAWINPTGGPLLASGGSGDVLSGVIGGLMAQGLEAAGAALAGVFVHGLAGQLAEEDYGRRGLAAEELADYLPRAFRQVEESHSHDHDHGEDEEEDSCHH
ncbi:MAG: NAD(P)H-hydrate dehydratase [Deltaproteobacteria bacterium]|nr:NAD(P)H-hydrate dehydratase [Deltaproteobacteria bacterium]